MPKLKVYISSTFLDLKEERKIIVDRVREGLTEQFELAEIMEMMDGDFENRSNIDVCLDEVRNADLYIILIGKRYGSHPDEFTTAQGLQKNSECLSYTELEYDTACQRLDEKFYGISKFELTDAFFADTGIEINKFAETDPVKIERLNKFSDKLGKTFSKEINTGNELFKAINSTLTDFFAKYNTKVSINIHPSDKVSINRTEVLSEATKIPYGAGTRTLIIGAENENDGYEEFAIKLQNILLKKSAEKLEYQLIRSSDVINYATNDETLLNWMLVQSSTHIYGEIQPGADFSFFPQDVKTIKNVFIGFVVDSKMDIVDEGFNFIKAIASFIKKIDSILIKNNFRFYFYFLIYIEYPPNEQLPNVDKYFDGLKYYPVGTLDSIKKDHVLSWLKEIKKRNNIEEEEEALFRLVFLGDDKFPSKYKKCIELIDKRTTKQ